jgi:hypothetical protein
LLAKTYQEEKATDEKLTQLAKQMVNQEAEEGEEDGLAPKGKKTGAKGKARK